MCVMLPLQDVPSVMTLTLGKTLGKCDPTPVLPVWCLFCGVQAGINDGACWIVLTLKCRGTVLMQLDDKRLNLSGDVGASLLPVCVRVCVWGGWLLAQM